jgi:16S rRNA (uracil1498-N3)-methyltransferase
MVEEQEGRSFLFYHAELVDRDPGEIILLDEEESRHLRSLRLEAGEAVILTDGRGRMVNASLEGSRGRRREVRIRESRRAPDALDMELAVAVGNRTRMLWLIEKATEFGVTVVSLLETERSRSVSDAGRSDGFRAKAERRALAAMKQSGGARVPEIRAPVDLSRYLAGVAAREIGTGVLLVPGGAPLAERLATARDPIIVLVGPEGGLTGSEIRGCNEAGFLASGLGPTVLRFETAALAAVAVVAQRAASRNEEGKDR